jgi:hypothetical protein
MYKLINPSIEGEFNNSFSGKSHLDAALGTWNSISKYITNNVPQFAFTLENKKNGQLHHFLVKESLVGGKSAKFDISELDIKLKKNEESEFKKRIHKFKTSEMRGGKKKRHTDDDDDDSSSSSSTSDIFSALKLYKSRNPVYPITYWWYDPIIYGLDSVYIPTFVAPITPYIEVTTLNYYP